MGALALPTDSTEYMPPLELRRFAQALLSEEVKGNKEKAAQLTGVDKGKFYYAFKKIPEFRKWFSDQCDLFLKANEHVPAHGLIEKCQKGDVKAINTYYEMQGKLKRTFDRLAPPAETTRLIVVVQKEGGDGDKGTPDRADGKTIVSVVSSNGAH